MFLKKKAIVCLSFIILLIGIQCVPMNSTSSKSPDISYESHIKPIMAEYCVSCHSGWQASANLHLNTYAAVKKRAEEGTLLKRVNDKNSPMPPMGLMPPKERQRLAEWAKNNFKEKSDKNSSDEPVVEEYTFDPPEITPVNINEQGFEFFTQMQGHWVGKLNLMGQDMPWFAFDYRPISNAYIHGIFEGGTIGNLMTSFYLAEYKGIKTIMARNGGVLNGIYRMSYFILDQVKISENESYYRFVDAYGGKQIMWMELKFKGEDLEFNSYTSRMGMLPKPKKHMLFKGKKTSLALSNQAAKTVGFPKKIVEDYYPEGLPMPVWDKKYPVVTSQSYMWEDLSADLVTLGKWAYDPIRIDEMPHLAQLKLKFNRTKLSKNKKIQVYLSRVPLTDDNGKFIMENGYIQMDLMNEVLLFPEIGKKVDEFTLTYLHPGDYYVTTFIDEDGNLTASKGDISTKSIKITVEPESEGELNIPAIEVKN